MFEWNEAKRRANLDKHGVDFEDVWDLDWINAVTREDTRSTYEERRFISTGILDGRLHVCVWTERGGKRRIISLRKANPRERKLHEQAQKLH